MRRCCPAGIAVTYTHLRLAGPKRFDRVARYKAMQALWAKDAFLKSGAGGAGGSGGLIGMNLISRPACGSMHLTQSAGG